MKREDQRVRIDHFTVVGKVTWPLSGSEAGVDLVLIQTSLLLLNRAAVGWAVSCSAFGFFFVGEQTQTPTANCLHRMMSSSANYRPFLSSSRHISPSGGFCQVSELTVYTKKWRPSAMGVRTFARIKHLIWDQLLASKADIIQS